MSSSELLTYVCSMGQQSTWSGNRTQAKTTKDFGGCCGVCYCFTLFEVARFLRERASKVYVDVALAALDEEERDVIDASTKAKLGDPGDRREYTSATDADQSCLSACSRGTEEDANLIVHCFAGRILLPVLPRVAGCCHSECH